MAPTYLSRVGYPSFLEVLKVEVDHVGDEPLGGGEGSRGQLRAVGLCYARISALCLLTTRTQPGMDNFNY